MALVYIEDGSEPAFGSVNPKQPISSPLPIIIYIMDID